MDPLTAFSLACGVIQVIDFSTKVLFQCREIYKNGSLAENESIEAMAEHLTTLRADLQPSTTAIGTQTAGDTELLLLSDRCSEMAKELVVELGGLKVGSSASKWKAGRVVFRGLRKKGTIEGLQRDLDGCRRVLDTKVLADLRQRSIQNSLLQTEGFRELNRKIQTMGDRLSHERQTFDELREVIRKHSESTNAHFDSRFQQYEKSLAKREYDKAVLESLWYSDIQAREEGIKDAHARTFEWLLDDSKTAVQSWDNFVAWLEGGQGTYWISGKAGSGKSTLMRYICDNDRTKVLLRAWAGSRQVLIVKFFFWRAGSPVQKTIVGLLRSLLYQIFTALPELIGTMSANNVSPASQYGAILAWTETRLKTYLRALLWELAKSHRVCLFLDGLDELDQSYEQILSIIRDLLEYSDVKICLSSRPYRIFSDALSSSAMLKLHDLTKADIRTYVTESLLPRDSIQNINGSTFDIPSTIVARADGVFLWAELVVRDVNRGIANEDSQQQLQHRLDSLPDEIEQLYGYMLGCIDNVYKTEAARCFSTLMNSTLEDRGSLLDLSLVIREGQRDDHPLAFADLSAAQTLDLCNATMRRLPTTCAGLVEIYENIYYDDSSIPELARLVLPSQFAVSDIDLDDIPLELLELLRIRLNVRPRFVHRTALDFLLENSVGKKFMKDHSKYAVHECVSRLNGMVAVWRLLGCCDPAAYSFTASKNRRLISPILQGYGRTSATFPLLFQAVLTESTVGTAQSVLWNYVEKATEITTSSYLVDLKGGPRIEIPQDEQASREDRWAKKTVDVASMVVPSMPEDFLGYAAFLGLSFYVESRVHSDPGLQCKATYLLACFVSNIFCVLKISDSLPSNDAHRPVNFVRYLLDHGADPNAATASSTIWGDFLENLYTAYLESRELEGYHFHREEWALMTMAFLDKGANTAQSWKFRSEAFEALDFAVYQMDPDTGAWQYMPLGCENLLFGFNGNFSIFTILLTCLGNCDEWAHISSKINVSHKERSSKFTRFYFADRGPEGCRPFVGYPLSDQQSEDFSQIYERIKHQGLDNDQKLVKHVLALRRELEEAASGAGTKVVPSEEH